jgi:hypothetical protein
MWVRSCGARRCRKCGRPKRFGMTAGRPAKAPVLHHMRKKPSLAGRRGRGGVGFSFILKRLLHMSGFRPAIATASCAHPAMLTAKWLPRANRLCAAGSNKPRTLEAVRLSAANSALRGWRGSPAPSGSARIADAGARWLRRYNNHAALRWCCRSALRFPAHHRAFYTGAFREPLAIGTVSHAASWLRSGTLGSWASSPVALLCSANF